MMNGISEPSLIIESLVSQVSTHGRLNITHYFGPHGCLPKIKILYICIEAATVAPRNVVHGRLPGSGRLSSTLWYTQETRIYIVHIPYSGKFSREKTFADR